MSVASESAAAESAVVFGDSARLVGLLTEGRRSRDDSSGRPPAVLLLNSGLIHRVAPGRLYVRLARALAERGHDCLRFDFSGIGDSTVRTDALPVEQSGIAETVEAMDWLANQRAHERFVLLGLCGGGYFSFRTACRDERVEGLGLLNVRGHLEEDDPDLSAALGRQAMQIHYRRVALSPSYRRKNVLKVLGGQFDVKGALASLRRRSGAKDGEEIAEDTVRGSAEAYDALCERGVRILNIYSEGDWSLDYLQAALGPDYQARLDRPGTTFELIRGTNHVFTPRWSQQRVIESVVEWSGECDWTDDRA